MSGIVAVFRGGREHPFHAFTRGSPQWAIVVGTCQKSAGYPVDGSLWRVHQSRLGVLSDVQQVRGGEPSKAAAIRSAFLLAQRLVRETYLDAPVVDCPERAAGLLREEYRPMNVENFHVLCLNTRRRLVSADLVAQGTLDSVLVHPREVFALAVSRRAWAVILVHNHPSAILRRPKRTSDSPRN